MVLCILQLPITPPVLGMCVIPLNLHFYPNHENPLLHLKYILTALPSPEIDTAIGPPEVNNVISRPEQREEVATPYVSSELS